MRRLIRNQTVKAAGSKAGRPFLCRTTQKHNTKPQRVAASSTRLSQQKLPMAQTRQMRRPLFEAPAPVCVCGLLVVAALTKGGHFHWAIGGMISAYLLYLAVQYAKHGASRARALGVAHSMMKHSDIHRRSDDDGYDCRSDSPDVRSACSAFTP